MTNQSTNTTPDNGANNQPMVNEQLDEIMDKIYDLAYDHLTERGIAIGTVRIKQSILDWHNKQTLELLDRLEAKLSHFGHDATVNIEAERKRINKTEKQ